MKTTVITCDQCERDITTTANCIDWRILLTSEHVPSRSGPVTAMMEYPQIDQPRYFCKTACLKEWVSKNL